MYAYVMRPETLPASYWKFIVKSGPVEAPALEAVRRSIRKLPTDLQAFNAFLKKRGSAALLATAFPKQVQPYSGHGGESWGEGGGGGRGCLVICSLIVSGYHTWNAQSMCTLCGPFGVIGICVASSASGFVV